MFFNKNKEEPKEEKKEEKVCFTCGCFFKDGVEVIVRRPFEYILPNLSSLDYCLGCAPKYNTIIFDRNKTTYSKNNVECDENGIPLIGLEKPKSK